MATTAAALKKIADAAQPLYQTLDEGQKRRLTVLTRMERRMRREGQDHELGQPLPDRIALGASEFDRRANEVGAALRIDDETVSVATRKKQERRFIEPEVVPARLNKNEFAALEEVQVAHLGVLHRLA